MPCVPGLHLAQSYDHGHKMNGMPGRQKTNLSVRVRADLAARLRTFVRDNAGKPLYLTLASFCEDAIEAHLRSMERKLAVEERLGNRNANNSRT